MDGLFADLEKELTQKNGPLDQIDKTSKALDSYNNGIRAGTTKLNSSTIATRARMQAILDVNVNSLNAIKKKYMKLITIVKLLSEVKVPEITHPALKEFALQATVVPSVLSDSELTALKKGVAFINEDIINFSSKVFSPSKILVRGDDPAGGIPVTILKANNGLRFGSFDPLKQGDPIYFYRITNANTKPIKYKEIRSSREISIVDQGILGLINDRSFLAPGDDLSKVTIEDIGTTGEEFTKKITVYNHKIINNNDPLNPKEISIQLLGVATDVRNSDVLKEIKKVEGFLKEDDDLNKLSIQYFTIKENIPDIGTRELDVRYQANPYVFADFRDCNDVTINFLEIDGNDKNLIRGGYWGDHGYQVSAHGIRSYNSKKFQAINIYAHHNVTDGIIVGWEPLDDYSPLYPHTLDYIRSEYNGRQGLSVVGANALKVTNSSFSYTGRGAVITSPHTGIDIEAEDTQVVRGAEFRNVNVIANYGWGLGSSSGNGGYTTFYDSKIVGTTAPSMVISKPGFSFIRTTIVGSISYLYSNGQPMGDEFNPICPIYGGKDENGEPIMLDTRIAKDHQGNDYCPGAIEAGVDLSTKFKDCDFIWDNSDPVRNLNAVAKFSDSTFTKFILQNNKGELIEGGMNVPLINFQKVKEKPEALSKYGGVSFEGGSIRTKNAYAFAFYGVVQEYEPVKLKNMKIYLDDSRPISKYPSPIILYGAKLDSVQFFNQSNNGKRNIHRDQNTVMSSVVSDGFNILNGNR